MISYRFKINLKTWNCCVATNHLWSIQIALISVHLSRILKFNQTIRISTTRLIWTSNKRSTVLTQPPIKTLLSPHWPQRHLWVTARHSWNQLAPSTCPQCAVTCQNTIISCRNHLNGCIRTVMAPISRTLICRNHSGVVSLETGMSSTIQIIIIIRWQKRPSTLIIIIIWTIITIIIIIGMSDKNIFLKIP